MIRVESLSLCQIELTMKFLTAKCRPEVTFTRTAETMKLPLLPSLTYEKVRLILDSA